MRPFTYQPLIVKVNKMNNPLLYLVKKGDTLESISKELGINNPADLRHYHNMNASIKDGIGPEPTVGKTLLTPPQNEIDVINKKNEEWQQVVAAAREKEEQQKQYIKDKEKEDLEQKEEKEKEEAKSAHENKYFVVHGALCACDKAENPNQTAKLLVTSHSRVILNAEAGKFFATEIDKTFDPPGPTFGKCKLKPSSGGYLPCSLSPAPKWTKVFDKTQVFGNKVLTEISTLQCTVGGKIEVVKSGQTDTIMKEHSENTNPAALALINPAIKMPVLKTAYPSVSGITLKNLKNTPDFKSVSSTDTASVEKVTIRQNEECSFLAKIKEGNVNLTSWVIYDGFTGDKNKRLYTEEQLGTNFKYTFSAVGKYRIEGYGKPKKEDFEGGKYNKNYPDCSIDIEVIVNKLDGTELIAIDGENFAKKIGGKMRLRQNFPASFKAKFLITPTIEELANLKMHVTDALGNVLKSTRIENTVSFTPTNSKALYKITAVYKPDDGETQIQSFTAETIANSVAEITHDAAVIRPGTPMTFAVKESRFSLYIPDEQEAISKEVQSVKWNLNGRLMGTGRNITIPGYELMQVGKYVVEAYVTLANAYGEKAKHEDDDWHFEVKENVVISFSYNGIPKVGKTTQLEADTIFEKLIPEEQVVWDTDIPHQKVNLKTISIKPEHAGKQVVQCRVNRQKAVALSIDVKQAKILSILFTDNNGIEIEKSSWYQTVNIWVKQENLIGEDLTIEIWDNDAFKNDYCKVINVSKYDGNLIPLTLDSYIKSKAGNWGMLYVTIGAPKLKLGNPDNIFQSKNHLDVEDKREIYSAQIGTQDAKQRHYHVDYNQVSYFYGKSRAIKAGEKLKITIYEKGKMLFEVLPPDVVVDESGAIKAKLQWDRISQKLPSRTVCAVVTDQKDAILYNGAKSLNGGVAITKKSALLGLAEYKSAVLVKKPESNADNKSGVCECESYNLYYGKKVNCAFRKKVMAISKQLWPDNYKEMANGLMAVMHRETSKSMAANQLEGYKSLIPREQMTKDIFNKINPLTGAQSSRAVGLIQFTQNSLVQMKEFTSGTGFDKLHALKLSYANMTEVIQLDKVKKYMESVKVLPKVPEDIYIAVFAPDFVGKRDATMYKKGTNDYLSNASLDKDDNGIQIKELLVEFRNSLAGGMAYSKYKCENSEKEESNGDCPQEKCIHYEDVVDNPRISNQSKNVNKNRWHRVQRINNSHPKGYYHTGVDILTSLNTPLKSLLCGTVTEAYDTNGDLGKIVTIKSKDKDDKDVWIRYCHLNSIDVKKGDIVKHGKKIGNSGNTGNAKDIKVEYYHVHIEASTDGVFYGGNTRVDPELYMKTKFDETTQGNPIK